MKKETLSIRFLYGTKVGRCCLKILIQPWISKAVGAFLSTPLSRPIVTMYVKKNKVDLSAYPQRSYHSFNDFFTRKRNTDQADTTAAHLISPCDAYLTVYPIDDNRTYHIKHIDYHLDQLLHDPELAARYTGGTCLIFRLTPSHYHRYCFSCSGNMEAAQRINGKLHCVRPIAYTSMPVFAENSREYVLIDSPEFGKVIQMEIGALLVGKISNHKVSFAQQATEKGYFEFGGSTIILLLEKDRIAIDPNLLALPETEKDVSYGSRIGVQIKK